MAFRKSVFLIGTILATGFATQVRAQSSPSAFTFATRYDADRRVVGSIAPDPDGAGALHYAAVRNTYDAAGRLIRVEKGELSAWQSEAIAPVSWTGFTVLQQVDTTYDPSDHKLTEMTSLGGTAYTLAQTSYDLAGRVDCTTERMNAAAFVSLPAGCALGTQGSYGPDRIARNTYDAADQLLKITKAYGTSLQQDYAIYAYSQNGKQTSVTDANGNYAAMTYDGFDREVQWTFPSPTTHGSVNASDFEAYGYDANGNRTSLRRRDGTTINYTYDALNRVSQKTVPASVTGAPAYSVFIGYDNRGLELYARFASTAGAGITNSYDNAGRLTSSISNMDGTNRSTSYQDDADGNLTQLNGDGGYAASYAYDGVDRDTAVVETGSGVTLAQLSYDQLGRRGSMGLGFGSTTSSATYGYDGVSRLTSLSHDLAGTSADQSLTFGYSPASQIVSRSSSNDSYASNTALNVSRSYAVNGLNQYTSAGPASFTYDANGNLKADGSNSYVYDGENRLVSSTGVNTVSLAYDPMGRLWQTSGGSTGTTRFLYDGDQRIIEEDGSGTLLRVYVHGREEDEPLVWYEYVGGLSRRFLHSDQQGSITAIADANGNPIAINAYDAWGIPNPANQGRFGYTGQTWIPELGMWYYKARIYSPTLGRFLQTDPVGYKDQVNLYAYVGNDPVDHADPTGLAELNLVREGDPAYAKAGVVEFPGAFTIFAHSADKPTGAIAVEDQRVSGNAIRLSPYGLLQEALAANYRPGQLTLLVSCLVGMHETIYGKPETGSSFAQRYADLSGGRVIASPGNVGVKRDGENATIRAQRGFFSYDPKGKQATYLGNTIHYNGKTGQGTISAQETGSRMRQEVRVF